MRKPSTHIVVAVLALMLGSGVIGLPASATTPGPGVISTRLPLPSDASPDASPDIFSVSCGAPGSCVAVGSYRIPVGTYGQVEPLIETLSGGVWTAQRAPVPADGVGVAVVSGVSCTGATGCGAWGSYANGPTTDGYMGLIFTGGQWKAEAILAPSGGVFTQPLTGNAQPVSGVGCVGDGACTIVGNFVNSGNALRAWTSVYHTGHWGPALVAPTPNDATAQESHLNGVACGGGLCQAVGNYTNPVGWEPLVVSIDPVADTVNSPSSHPNLPQGAVMINDLDGIACDAGGSCAAYGSYPTSGGSNSEALVFPVGGMAFQPQMAPTPTAQSTAYYPAAKIFGAGCAAGTCLLTGYYYDSANQYHALVDRFGAGGGAADTAPNGNVPTLAACGATDFCIAAVPNPYGQPIDVLVSQTWTALPLALPADAIPSALTSAFEQASACDSATSCWVLGSYSATSGNSSVNAPYADHVTPTAVASTPPSLSSTSGMPTFALGSSASFGWHGTPGSSPIDHYTVQVRRSTWKGGFGAWSTPSGWGTLPASTSSVSVPLPVGDDTCVRVEAVDTAHLASAWSSARCTARPLDDRSLSATSAWARLKGSGYYFGTYTSTKTSSATMTLTSAQFDRLALVATKCATCGKVAVYSGSTLLTTINLYRSTTAKRVLIVLSKVSLRTANIRLRVVTSGKSVQIDGLGVTRT